MGLWYVSAPWEESSVKLHNVDDLALLLDGVRARTHSCSRFCTQRVRACVCQGKKTGHLSRRWGCGSRVCAAGFTRASPQGVATSPCAVHTTPDQADARRHLRVSRVP